MKPLKNDHRNRVKQLRAGRSGRGGGVRSRTIALAFVAVGLTLPLLGGERRAKPPSFSNGQFENVFYDELSDAVQPTRPSAPQLHGAAIVPPQMAGGPATNGNSDAEDAAGTGWSALVSPVALEDEVKRLKLHFDSVVTTPGPFKSGGYQEARVDLSILATLFAVIGDYEGDVRWKDQGAAARDLLARTAFNCKAGSIQVYNEAKLRKTDLQDLVSGSGLASREAEEENDWSMIVDRSPIMEYLEWVNEEELKAKGNNKASIEENKDSLRRYAEMVALMGQVLLQEGLDDSDDTDYQALSQGMSKAAMDVRSGLDRNDAEAVRTAISAIGQSCDACHEQFR